MKYLVAGLGNKGDQYTHTRHNVGFMVMDHIIAKQHVEMTDCRHALQTTIRHRGRTLHLIKPTDYMNRSGQAVSYWMKKWDIPLSRILIVVDDIALPFGTMKLRWRGGSGGHNGLADIEMRIDSKEYCRLRIGIGNTFSRGKQTEYVLGNFTPEEQEALPTIQARAEEIIYTFCVSGVTPTMNRYN